MDAQRRYEIEKDFSKDGKNACWAPGHPTTWGSEHYRLPVDGPIECAALSPCDGLFAVASVDSIVLLTLPEKTSYNVIDRLGRRIEKIEWQPLYGESPRNRMVIGTKHIESVNDRFYRRKIFVCEIRRDDIRRSSEHRRDGIPSQQTPDTVCYREGDNQNNRPLVDTKVVLLGDGMLLNFESKAFSNDGGRMILSRDKSNDEFVIDVWDTSREVEDWTCIISISEPHTRPVAWVGFSPDGRAFGTTSLDKTTKLWNATTGELLWTFESGAQNWTGAFSSDCARLAYGSADPKRGLVVLDVSTGATVFTDSGFPVWTRSIAWSPDGHHLAYGAFSGALRIRSTTDYTIKQDWQLKYVGLGSSGYREIRHIKWLDEGQRVAFYVLGKDEGFEVYDARQNLKWRMAPPKEMKARPNRESGSRANRLLWCQRERLLICVDFDQSVRFWHLPI